MSREIYRAVNKSERPMQWVDHRSIIPSCRMHHPTSFFKTKEINGIKFAFVIYRQLALDFRNSFYFKGF